MNDEGAGRRRGTGANEPTSGGAREHVRGGGGGAGAQHYGPRGRSGLQVPILVRERPPRRGRGL